MENLTTIDNAVLIFCGGFAALVVLSFLDATIEEHKLFFISEDVIHPIVEEIMWRLPLLILFTSLTATAWLAIVISGVAFGVFHLIPLLYGRKKDEYKELDKREKDFIKLAFIVLSILASFFGIVLGLIVVLTHSLLLVISLHALWNSLSPYTDPPIERWLRRING